MKLTLVRHGETVWNKEGRPQGWADSPLTERGREQARALGEALRGIYLDAIYVSPAGRAQATADIALGEHPAPRYTEERLMEHGLGALEGLSRPEIEERFGPDVSMLHPPEGESMQALSDRLRSFTDELLTKGHSSVLLLFHGAALRQTMANLLDDGSIAAFERMAQRGATPHATPIPLLYEGGRWRHLTS